MILILYIVLLIGLLIGYQSLKNNRVQSRQYKAFVEVFQNPQITLPTLKFGSSYSWPTFEVIFAKREDYEFAERNGLFDLFKNRIKAFYGKEFRSDSAVDFTYIGYVPSWKMMMNEEQIERGNDDQSL